MGVSVIKNEKLVDVFSALQNEMIADTNLSLVVDHPVDKGSNTEECWIDWFNEYLPKRYHAAKATVIDSNGNRSDQIDVENFQTKHGVRGEKGRERKGATPHFCTDPTCWRRICT